MKCPNCNGDMFIRNYAAITNPLPADAPIAVCPVCGKYQAVMRHEQRVQLAQIYKDADAVMPEDEYVARKLLSIARNSEHLHELASALHTLASHGVVRVIGLG